MNHLTAARVYRRLAELGYVTASVGRGTFVRSLAAGGQQRARRRLAGLRAARARAHLLGAGARGRASSARPGRPDLARRRAGPPRACTRPTSWRGSPPTCSPRRAARRSPTCPPRACYALREQIAARGRGGGLRRGAGRDRRDLGREAGDRPGRPRDARARATWRWSSRPPSSACSTRCASTGARVIGVPVDEDGLDVDALERLLARHEVKLVALQTACQNPTGRDLSEERRAAAGGAGGGAQLLRARGPRLRRRALRGRASAGRCASSLPPT